MSRDIHAPYRVELEFGCTVKKESDKLCMFSIVWIHAFEVGRYFFPGWLRIDDQAACVDITVDHQPQVNNFLQRLTHASRKEESSLVVELAWIFSEEFEHRLVVALVGTKIIAFYHFLPQNAKKSYFVEK
jgi:hypothetical protein